MSVKYTALIVLNGWSWVMVHIRGHYVWELCDLLSDC